VVAEGEPARFSSTARIIWSRCDAKPVTVRCGVLYEVGVTRAWISTRIGRVPSSEQTTVEPLTPYPRSDRKISLGLGTSRSPSSRISKTPISLAAPNRFLTLRRMR
jgi:hypothetical protein